MVNLDDGAIDDVLLALEDAGLLGDVFGKRVERGELLVGGAAQLLELGEAAQTLFNVLDGFQRRKGVVIRLARDLPGLRVVLRQLRGDAAQLFQLGPQRGRLFD